MNSPEAHAFLRQLLEAAITAADPARVLAKKLPEKPEGKCVVVGAGKSAASMARAVELAWPDVDISGVVVTRYGHSVPTERVKVLEASHPVPDDAGAAAAREILKTACEAGPDDLVLALLSGGGSALMPLPKPPLTLENKILVHRLLLQSGLAIEDMNRIRRRLSLLKGGGLARAAKPARVVTLAISDIPGDDPAAIASGPTLPDPTAHEDLSHLVEWLGPELPQAARQILLEPSEPQTGTEPDFRLIATPRMSLSAAAEVALAAGVTPLLLGDAIEGEARHAGTVMGGIALSCARHGTPVKKPAVLLSGGETTVTIGKSTPGRGGRNTEYLLSLALALKGDKSIHALAADTDGIDGTEEAAGAIIGPDTLARADALGHDARSFLDSNDSYSFFDRLDTLVRTGPTLTNVNDFRAILVS
ncbi:glycerate kinase type-2 family protein [Roseibium album]|uniref:Putative hydroxypyruvate reductase n=1 Tax=Roseibium album TaxID=311410 RepID=A0A0M6ZMB3_9HYPH|nr:glycerate kinase [Roseibium album]CTQ63362.1 Putative hydroxypyruvate reductase [Roseibium album]CTQ79401.1 Putative hydroxypyruvate reductase [Roseibium album]CTQ80949.1 Putative hydroxypyruvate reductase [Roseibium album]